MPIANAFLYEQQFKDEYFFELAPTYCPNCSLFQLFYQPNPKLLFHENYETLVLQGFITYCVMESNYLSEIAV